MKGKLFLPFAQAVKKDGHVQTKELFIFETGTNMCQCFKKN